MALPLLPAREWRSTSGGSISGGDEPAFELLRRDPAPIPVLIAVPHAGRSYPETLLARMRNPGEAALRLEDRLVDLVARRVARETGAALLVAHAPRAMIDLNRAPDDVDWGMVANGGEADGREAAAGARGRHALGRRARGGLGLVPRRLPGLGELWRTPLGAGELEARIARVHQPYHQALGEMLEALRDRWGGALLVDLHSMPPLGDKTGEHPAPDFVIGDRFGASCSPALSAAALAQLAASGTSAAHNRPYAGGYVLDRHAAPARGIEAMQVELCRAAYLDTNLRNQGPGLAASARVLTSLIRRLGEEVLDLHQTAQAAE